MPAPADRPDRDAPPNLTDHAAERAAFRLPVPDRFNPVRDVLEARAAAGRDDPARTQIVCAFVVLAPGHAGSTALAAERQAHCRTVTAPYKYPREVHFVEDLPKTVSGKIRRTELRDRLRAGSV